jgi:ABC-2 type transport system ATP-binding protein
VLLEVERICDRVGVMHRGRLIRSAAVAELVQGHPSLEVAVLAAIHADDDAAKREAAHA